MRTRRMRDRAESGAVRSRGGGDGKHLLRSVVSLGCRTRMMVLRARVELQKLEGSEERRTTLKNTMRRTTMRSGSRNLSSSLDRPSRTTNSGKPNLTEQEGPGWVDSKRYSKLEGCLSSSSSRPEPVSVPVLVSALASALVSVLVSVC